MVTHMKTTIEIPDALLKEAKDVAAARGTTLKELVATGLHAVVHDARNPLHVSYRRHNGRRQRLATGRERRQLGNDPIVSV